MKTILIAEDDDTNFLIISKFIQKNRGFEVERAKDGLEVVEKISANPNDYSCILMDIKMPFLNGLEATKQIKAKNIKVPIIAVTAAAMFGDKELALEAGVDNYITKPIDYTKLFEILDNIAKN